MNVKYPQSNEEAAALVAAAARDKLAVVPAGNLTALKHDPVVTREDLMIISARELNHFVLEPENLLALAGAGLTSAEVEEKLAGSGLYWPVTGLGFRTLGAIMAEGALGLETMARGSMVDWVLGTTLIGSEGQVVSSGGRTLKNVSGYDFTRLSWRARGRLGLSAAFILKLLPRPEQAPVLEIQAPGAAEAADLGRRIILARLAPEALRLQLSPGRTVLLAWLTGFSELVAHKEAAIRDLAGALTITRHDDGFAFWKAMYASAPSGPDSNRAALMGSRKNILELAEKLSPIEPGVQGADLDIGGGRAGLDLAPGRQAEELAALVQGLAVDAYVPSGPIYERLRKGLDPGSLFFPDRLSHQASQPGQE